MGRGRGRRGGLDGIGLDVVQDKSSWEFYLSVYIVCIQHKVMVYLIDDCCAGSLLKHSGVSAGMLNCGTANVR